MNRKILIILLHVVGWALFFSIPYFFSPPKITEVRPAAIMFDGVHANIDSLHRFMPPGRMRFGNPFHSPVFICINILLFIYFYVNAFLLMPKLFLRKKYFLYAGITSALLVFILFVPGWINSFSHRENMLATRFRNPDMLIVFLFLVVFLMSACIYIMQQWLHAEKRNRAIEHDKLETELAFLKSQINPHFLFNTLNNIYSLAVTKNEFTADAILKLSDMMRYVVTDGKLDIVPLSKEIEYLQHFIELQKIRLTDKVRVEFHVSGETAAKQIAPLLLISFIENAFKHGVSAHAEALITINIFIEQQQMELYVANNVHSMRQLDGCSSGTGLLNARRRLNLLYDQKHSLHISASEELFEVRLLIDLT